MFNSAGGGFPNAAAASPWLSGTGGGGWGATLGNLFQNKLFLQYLSGAGAAMQQGEPIGPTLNKTTQQNIGSQNYMNLLKKMLGGEIPTGGKMTMDEKGLKLEAPKEALGGMGGGMVKPGGDVNPSASPLDVSSADLAGLTPEMISQALQFKFAQDEMSRKSLSDVVDMRYKGALIKEAEARTKAATPSITIPGTDIKVNSKEYLEWYKAATKDERTAAIKNFEYARTKGFKGSFEQFQDNAKTGHQKDFEAAKADGYEGSFNEWMLDMAKAGAINLGEVVERKKATEDIEAQSKVTSAEFLSKMEKEARADTSLDKYEFGSPEYETQVKLQVLRKLDSEIRNAYKGSSVVRSIDGWYVDGKLVRRNPYAK